MYFYIDIQLFSKYKTGAKSQDPTLNNSLCFTHAYKSDTIKFGPQQVAIAEPTQRNSRTLEGIIVGFIIAWRKARFGELSNWVL